MNLMRLYPIILSLLLLGNRMNAQTDPFDAITNETPAQRVTNKFIATLSLSASDKTAIKKAVDSLEAKGLYYKLLTLNIGKYFANNKCYNLVNPSDYDGAFIMTILAGNPQQVPSGIRLANGDRLNTHFSNDRATDAPGLGVFWYTDIGVNRLIVTSNSPFKIEPRVNGKAFVNIWNTSTGIPVPASPPGFSLAQRPNNTTVEIYQGATRYATTLNVLSASPLGRDTYVQGNTESPFVLKVFGITEALSPQEVADLKTIIDQLVTDLGI